MKYYDHPWGKVKGKFNILGCAVTLDSTNTVSMTDAGLETLVCEKT
jgi:hypothetical protein